MKGKHVIGTILEMYPAITAHENGVGHSAFRLSGGEWITSRNNRILERTDVLVRGVVDLPNSYQVRSSAERIAEAIAAFE